MKHAFTGEEYKGVPFLSYEDLQKSRNESSKSVNQITYDRYEKYHCQPGEMSKLDKKLGNIIENVINFITKVISNAS